MSVLFLLGGVVLAVGPTPSKAQFTVTPGIQGGLMSTTYAGDHGGTDVHWQRGAAVGFFATIDFDGAFAVRPELNFVQKGAEFRKTRGPDGQTATLSYLELPLLANVQLWRSNRVTPVLFAGPALGLRVQTHDRLSDVRRAEAGVVVGSGFEIDIGERGLSALRLDARYQTDVFENEYRWDAGPNLPAFRTGTLRNRGVVFMLGLSF